VEHVFGCMTMAMGGKLTRKIGIERNESWWGLKNLTFNFLRFLHALWSYCNGGMTLVEKVP
jgi:hypothetical protein